MNRIKEVIKEKGLTITSLADKLGIARESLSRMIVSPSYPTLEKIYHCLRCTHVAALCVTGRSERRG
jgi:transcriptional regulator with XRE-family HTH domain